MNDTLQRNNLQTRNKPVNGAQAVILSLIAEKVDTIFGYPGGAVIPIYDALFDHRDQIHHILVRHEQGAGHAAEGYARASGRVGVCLVTSGPGATNMVTPIADALMDSVPMVCIVGQVATPLLGTDAFQEADIIGVTMPISKWSYQIVSADEIPEMIAKAFFIAGSGRPGPVVLDITKTAQTMPMTHPFDYIPCMGVRGYQPVTVLNQASLQQAADLLNQAKKPYVFIGQGVIISKAEKEILALAEKINIPLASTLQGLSGFPSQHPLYVGMLGMHGNYGANLLTNEADVILAVGMRFDDRVTGNLNKFIPQAKVIHIDIDPAEIDKNVISAISIQADAKQALKALLPLLEPKEYRPWLNQFKEYGRQEYEKIIVKEIYPDTPGIKMGEVVHKLYHKTQGKSIIVTDVGQHQMIAAKYYQFAEGSSFISSGGLGTMGFGIPAAFGAKVARPDKEVIGIVGDGCFQMTPQELGTIAQSRLPVKIIVLNNNYLGMVRQWQDLFYDRRYSFVELQNPDFVMISKGFGIEAKQVTERKNLDSALDEMLISQTPFLLEVQVEKEVNIFPMIPGGGSVSDIRIE